MKTRVHSLFLFAIFTMVLVPILSQADTTPDGKTKHKTPPVTVVTEGGKPLTVRWPDNREAEIQFYRGPQEAFQIPFQVIENLCNDKVMMKCELDLDLSVFVLKLVWTKHSDAAKIGKTVSFIFMAGDSMVPIRDKGILDFSWGAVAPVAAAGLQMPELTCSDYSWVPGGTIQAPPERAYVSLWSNEYMFPNLETGVSENHAESAMLGVDLFKTLKGNLGFNSVKSMATVFPSIPTYLGETSTLFFRQGISASDLCQVTLKPKTEASQTKVNDLEKAAFEKPSAPYLYGSNEYYRMTKQLRTFMSELNVKHTVTNDGKTETFYTEGEVR